MNGTMSRLVANFSRVYSPLMLNHQWPRLTRLVFTLIGSVVGVIMNGFYVAAFVIDPNLSRNGYMYMVSSGLSDFIITATLLPTSAVVLLSGEWDTDPVCHALQFVAEAATYSYSVFSMMSAIESYKRVCKGTSDDGFLMSMRIGLVTTMLFTVTFLTAAAGVYMELDVDYCQRRHTGNLNFRIVTFVIFYVIPFVTILFSLANNACRISDKASKFTNYKRSQRYETERTTNNLNITAYFLFVAAWTPYLMVVYLYPDITDSKYYHCAWIGIFRSTVASFLYAFMDGNFRRAFGHLFNYCFCKSNLPGSYVSRHRRAVECKRVGNVRVHILHTAVNVNSPQRGASSSRETQDL